MVVIYLGMLQASAYAQMVFTLKFDTETTYNYSKILRPGESTSVSVYVSNIPGPGLVNMGFSLEFDPTLLQIAAGTTSIHTALWDINSINESDLAGGRIVVTGNSFLEGSKELLNDVKLATFTFTRLAKGHAPLTLRKPWVVDPEGPGTEVSIEGFILYSGDLNNPPPEAYLDEEIGDGIVIGSLADVGDYSGDGDVDGEDLRKLITEACPAGTCDDAAVIEFVGKYGTGGL